jgi:hypothetical protein
MKEKRPLQMQVMEMHVGLGPEQLELAAARHLAAADDRQFTNR